MAYEAKPEPERFTYGAPQPFPDTEELAAASDKALSRYIWSTEYLAYCLATHSIPFQSLIIISFNVASSTSTILSSRP